MDKYRYWFWVAYPLGMIIVILFSIRMVFSAETNKLVEANLKRHQAAAESEKVANLKAKLDYLNRIDQSQYIEDLKLLLTAVPASKKPWLTLAAMNIAASRSGIAVADFYGSIGEIKEASEAAAGAPAQLYIESKVKVADYATLRNFFNELHKLRPLIKVLGFRWSDISSEMQIDVSFSPWPKLKADPEGRVVENIEAKTRLFEKVKTFEDVDPLLEYSASMSGEPASEISPF